MKVRIWTYTDGSRTGRQEVIATEAEPLKTIDIDGKYTVHVFRNPETGAYHIADGTSGAFVASALTEEAAIRNITSDLRQVSDEVLMRNVFRFNEIGDAAEMIEEWDFWSRFEKIQ